MRPSHSLIAPSATALACASLVLAVCGWAAGTAAAARSVPREVVVKEAGSPHRVIKVKDVDKAIRALRRRDGVVYAVRNVIARAAEFVPNDPGRGTVAGGWQSVQWNFVGQFSVNAPEAWANAQAAKASGGRGVVIAVLDTGVAYKQRKPFRKSPDLRTSQFIRGYDFVDHDPYPYDRNGHGTHVASTIGEATNNGIGLTGLAYGATIMPIRVLDDAGEGDASDIAEGVRFAAKRGAKIINLSLEFSSDVTSDQIPELISAIRYAHTKGAVIVAASGNEGHRAIAYPARATSVISVGATTEFGCLSDFSNIGRGLDIVAPGGGADAPLPDDPNCQARSGRDIFQVTLEGPDRNRFGIPSSYQGTSMAAPHVSATAALVIATKVIGENPTPAAVERHLKATATDLGVAGVDSRYGHGLLNAAAATRPIAPPPPPAR